MNEFNTGAICGGSDSRWADDPFMLPSSNYIPKNLPDALDFCIYLYYINAQYRRASERIIAHFVTSVGFDGKDGDNKERRELKSYLEDQLNIYDVLMAMGAEWSAVGNSFWRIHYPFNRVLLDKREGKTTEYVLSSFNEGEVSFDLASMTYEIPDPRKTSGRVSLPFRDRLSRDINQISLLPLEARNITIRHSFMSGAAGYIYRFDKDYENDIRRGVLYQVNETPIAMLKAIAASQDFLFAQGEIFHFKSPAISGVSNRGWGVPETLLNYKELHQLQVYRKIDEQVGNEYMLPFRLFAPTDMNTEFSHGFQTDAGEWTHHISQLIKDRRQHPDRIHAFPFPVQYQEFGASGKQLAPKDLIEYQTNNMLDGMGFPAELFRGSLQVQQVPTALRMFENTFHFVHTGFDKFLKWVVRKVLDYDNREQIGVHLELPTVADDLEKRSVYMQLAAGGEISRAMAYRSFNISDPIEEARKRVQEDNEIAKIRDKEQKSLEREMSQGTPQDVASLEGGGEAGPEGAAPAQGGGVTPVDSLQGQAEELAAQLLQIPDDGTRSKEMTQIRVSNPELHAMVKQKMEEMRSLGASAGRKQVAQML